MSSRFGLKGSGVTYAAVPESYAVSYGLALENALRLGSPRRCIGGSLALRRGIDEMDWKQE